MYLSLAELRAYLGVIPVTDDALLTAFLAAAEKAVDSYCGRRFEASPSTAYHYTASSLRMLPGLASGKVLWLGRENLAVTQLLNGDGVEIPAAGYVLEPRDDPPYRYVRLKITYAWAFGVDGEIQVTGTWGYSATVPEDVKQAMRRLAAYYYRGRDSQVFDVTATPELGTITIPKGIPADVKVLLEQGGYVWKARFA